MYRPITALLALAVSLSTQAAPEYATIKMEIDVAKPAAEVWAKVGAYCDIAKWAPQLDCEIVSGNGGIGTVRSLAKGRIKEILVGKTDLSYGYAQPVVEGKFYDQYHGFMEAKPVSSTSSKILYTLMVDESDKADQAAKDADVARRRTQFEGLLKVMKQMAEAK
ncbi:MAG: SRPBCC family protein [Gammaproteobacteria bacterium]|jgi:hypothetical protein